MIVRRTAALLWAVTLVAGCGTSTTATVQGTPSPPPTPSSPTSSPPTTPPTTSPLAPTSAPPATRQVLPTKPAPPPPAPPAPPVVDPAGVVTAYFAAINAQNYAEAWALGGKNLGQSFSQFASGYSGTLHDAVQIVGVSGDAVTIDLTATNTDGTQQQFVGTYTVKGELITGASVSQVQPAAGDLCGAPANPHGYNLCGRGTLIYSPQGDTCSYFNCIANFGNGNGYMIECSDGTYSMSGGYSEACTDHGGKAADVWSGP